MKKFLFLLLLPLLTFTQNNDSIIIIDPPPLLLFGCTEADACNFNPEASINDGTCEYYSCIEPCPDINENGICDEDEEETTDTLSLFDSWINIDIHTDDWPEETTWELLDTNDVAIASGGPYDSDQTLYSEFVELNSGIHLDANSYMTFGAKYGQKITDKINWFAGFNGLRFRGDKLMDAQLIHSTDTFRVYRDQEQFHNTYLLKGGIEYKPVKYIQIGLGLSIGYNKDRVGFDDIGEVFNDYDDEWAITSGAIRQYYPDLFFRDVDYTSASIGQFHGPIGHMDFLVTGVSYEIGTIIPVGQRIEILASYNGFLSRFHYLSNRSMITELNVDGIDVYPGINTFITESPSFSQWNNTITASLRVKL